MVQSCMAVMQIPKFDRDEDIFQKYSVKVGVRVYDNAEDTEPRSITEETFRFQLNEPDYDGTTESAAIFEDEEDTT